MTFDNSGRDVPEYEAFIAAIEMAEKDTKATMLRVAQVADRENAHALPENEKTSVGGQ
jgi:hypothetical protein